MVGVSGRLIVIAEYGVVSAKSTAAPTDFEFFGSKNDSFFVL